MAILVKFMCTLTGVLCLGIISEARDAANSGGHPIEKVINLLKGLKADVTAGGQKEAVSYQKFTLWCSTSIKELQSAVGDEKEQISELEDTKDGREKERDSLSNEISELNEQIKDIQASGVNASKDDTSRSSLYNTRMENLESTIEGVVLCIDAMTGANQKTEGEPDMLLAQMHVEKVLTSIQGDASVTRTQMSKLWSFAKDDFASKAISLQDPKGKAEPPDDEEEDKDKDKKITRAMQRALKEASRPNQLAAGNASAHEDKYDFKSEGVIELLKQLQLKFEDDKLAAIQAETNSQNEFALASQARDNAESAADVSRTKKAEEHGRVEAILADTVSSLTNVGGDLEEDSKTLADTKEQCNEKAREWDKRSKVRDLEIKAMDAAINILADVSGVRTKAPGNPMAPIARDFNDADDAHRQKYRDKLDFLQVDTDSNPKKSALAVIQAAAQETHSRAMERLAVEIKAHLSGPFNRVIGMVEKMIFRLMDEQKKEDEHKNWCDKEISKTRALQENKAMKLDDLFAESEVEKSKVGKLTEDIVVDDAMIAEIVTFMKDATEIREIGKKENKMAIKDADAAQKALGDAIAVLQSFYKETGEIPKKPWEFIQEPYEEGSNVIESNSASSRLGENPWENDEHRAWDNAEYKGTTDAQGQIVSVLEGVMAEFATMEAETKSQEAVDQKEYDQTMKDNKVEKARRTKESEMKASDKKRRATKIAELESHMKNTKEEKMSARKYLKDLDPACSVGDGGYKARVAARDTEIKALRRAQIILQDGEKKMADTQKKTSFLGIQRHGGLA